MPVRNGSRNIFEMSTEELKAAIDAAALPREEIERRHPHIAQMNARVAAAIKDLQEKGILDEHGRLIPPKELPLDMRPESDTEC
jgi:galactokinase